MRKSIQGITKRRLLIILVLIGLVGAALIPNAIICYVDSTGASAVRNLRDMAAALAQYYTKRSHSYPDTWQTDLYAYGSVLGPAAFNLDIQSAPQTVLRYDYHYTPLPVGCLEPHCSRYVITAVPHRYDQKRKSRFWKGAYRVTQSYKIYGWRSFFVDESGTIRHCTGETGAEATDQRIERAPRPCASSAQ